MCFASAVFVMAYNIPILCRRLIRNVRRKIGPIQFQVESSIESPMLTEMVPGEGQVWSPELELEGRHVDTLGRVMIVIVKVLLALAATIVFYPAVLAFTGWLSQRIGLGFEVAGFWSAVVGGWSIGIAYFAVFWVFVTFNIGLAPDSDYIRARKVADPQFDELRSEGTSYKEAKKIAIRTYNEELGRLRGARRRSPEGRASFVFGFLSL